MVGTHSKWHRLHKFSTGKPTTGLMSEASDRSSSTSSPVSLHPSAPPNSLACSAFLAPGMGTTLPCAMSQFRTTYQDKRHVLTSLFHEELVIRHIHGMPNKNMKRPYTWYDAVMLCMVWRVSWCNLSTRITQDDTDAMQICANCFVYCSFSALLTCGDCFVCSTFLEERSIVTCVGVFL